MMYRPQDYTGNKFFGVWSRVAALGTILNYEDKEKYLKIWQNGCVLSFSNLDKFNYQIKADLEMCTIPKCYDKCVTDVTTTALNPIEKNCMKDCYFKKLSSKDDVMKYMLQRMAIQKVKESKELLVWY